MRDLQRYADRCMAMLDNIGVKYGNIIEFTVNTRAMRRWGQCKAVPGGYSININYVLLDERNDESGLINTLLHELLHSCMGCMNHGENWKRLAEKVYREYGINIRRTSDAAEKGVNTEVMRRGSGMSIRHKYVCEGCGQVITRYRESKFTKNYKNYKCGICHSDFKEIF